MALSEPWIVQERTNRYEPYPSWVDGQLRVIDRMLDTDPFVSYGEYADGCLTRLSTKALLNVTAGEVQACRIRVDARDGLLALDAQRIREEGRHATAVTHDWHRRGIPDHRSADA